MITDGLSPITLLLFAGAVLGGGALLAAYVFARVTGREPLARGLATLGAAGAGLYVVLFLGAAMASRDRVLAVGEEKHICEVDCHLAYAVAGVTTTPSDDGVRYVVTVRVRFDEQTISSRRPRDLALAPNSRYVALVDAEGRRYPGATDGLTRRLVPGESYTTDLTFDLPAGAQGRHLILRSDDFETPFVIGHENSLFHGKTTFALRQET